MRSISRRIRRACPRSWKNASRSTAQPGTSEVLDAIKAQGYKYSTKGALTVAVIDAAIPPEKKELIAQAEAQVDNITKMYNKGLLSNEERYRGVIETWNETTTKVTEALNQNMDPYNPIFMMSDSGARGSISQIRQLAGMRGLIANTSGRTIEVPIRANYREGLNILEYFISSRGARKGLADTALRTADSGYLTRPPGRRGPGCHHPGRGLAAPPKASPSMISRTAVR